MADPRASGAPTVPTARELAGETASPRAAVQLWLPLGLRTAPTFANFVTGANAEVRHWVVELAQGVGPEVVYLWGGPGVGKTHLLEAACRQVAGRGERVGYLPLAQRERVEPAMLAGMETAALVCVDDLAGSAGHGVWEQALFHLMNGLRATGGRLLLAGRSPPAGLGLVLRDLASRVAGSLVLRLAPLSDPERVEALRVRAHERGFDLPEEVGEYLLRRYPRDLHTLVGLLDRLDEGSLAARRRVTLALVREVLGDR